ncbi:MAG: hypothetical protein WCR98_05975 [Saccharofermentanales bacterium]
MAKNRVIAGSCEGCPVVRAYDQAYISLGIKNNIDINKDTVADYEVLDETKSKSAISAAGRGLLGGLLLGPAGMLAGALTTKSKGTHIVAIEFKDGRKSLLEVDDKTYKAIMQSLF